MPNDEDRPQAEGPEERPAEDAAEDREDEAAADEAEALREYSDDELKDILAAHKVRVESDGENGQPANLYRANLQGASLRRANSQELNEIAFSLWTPLCGLLIGPRPRTTEDWVARYDKDKYLTEVFAWRDSTADKGAKKTILSLIWIP